MEKWQHLYSACIMGILLLLWYKGTGYFTRLALGNYYYFSLLLKIGFMLIMLVIHQFWYSQNDYTAVTQAFEGLSGLLLNDIRTYWECLSGIQHKRLDDLLIFQRDDRAWYFLRVFHPVYVISGNNIWTSSFFFTLVFHSITFVFVNFLHIRFHLRASLLMIAFFLLPTYGFWCSGYWKEPVVFSMLYASILLLHAFRPQPWWKNTGIVLLVILLWFISTRLKFYFVAPFLIFFIPYLTTRWLSQRYSLKPAWKVFCMAICMAFMVVVASQLHYTLSLSQVSRSIWINHFVIHLVSYNHDFIFENFGPSFYELLCSIPEALQHGFLSPFPSLLYNPLMVVFGIEYALLGSLFFILLFQRLRSGKIPVYWLETSCLVLFIFFSLCLLALTCPNPGTLSRYKTLVQPFWSMLVLHAIPDRYYQQLETIWLKSQNRFLKNFK
ncbi:MAG: hypothetical protein MUF42_01305 [Cytophagaceae bacterium]|jgi:hypothetical protein|nr:hypothetical protein [Cytophagaceae bacterium]